MNLGVPISLKTNNKELDIILPSTIRGKKKRYRYLPTQNLGTTEETWFITQHARKRGCSKKRYKGENELDFGASNRSQGPAKQSVTEGRNQKSAGERTERDFEITKTVAVTTKQNPLKFSVKKTRPSDGTIRYGA